MKKILVTGTAGRVGGEVARELLDHGYRIRALDIMPPRQRLREHEHAARIETIYVDLSDRLAILKAAEGCDAIAHLAAIPNPMNGEPGIMRANVEGTANILFAAEANGIARVALASSCCAYGIVFAKHDIPPQYLPMDEQHPCVNEDLYGLSKRFNEMTAEAFSRRSGITTVSLRLTTIVDARSTEHMEWRKRHLARSGGHRSREFWTYIDDADAAEAFRLSLEADISGHHVLTIAARDTFSPHSPLDLARHHYPDIPIDEELVAAQNCLYDSSLAESKIGWVAKSFWRDNEELRAVEAEPLGK